MINPFAVRREIASDHQINHLWLSRRELTGRSMVERSGILRFKQTRQKCLNRYPTYWITAWCSSSLV
jgi:hypothetical protein